MKLYPLLPQLPIKLIVDGGGLPIKVLLSPLGLFQAFKPSTVFSTTLTATKFLLAAASSLGTVNESVSVCGGVSFNTIVSLALTLSPSDASFPLIVNDDGSEEVSYVESFT